MKPIKVGFIGTGGIAQAHLRGIAGEEAIEVVAAADIVRANAEKTAERWGIPHVYEDYREMLEREDIEAVNVCTYNQAHCEPTVAALEAGKHVLVEKPMAATLEDAAAMAKAAHESDKIMMVALKTRYRPSRIAAKQIVDSGALGDIYYAEAVACRRAGIPGRSFVKKDKAGIGTVADIGVYALDEVLHLMGHPKPVTVSGIANNLLGTTHEPPSGSWKWDPEELEVEDFGVASVRFENGAYLTFKTSWIMHMDSLGGNLVLGTKAGLRTNPLTVFRHEFGMLTDTKPQLKDDSAVDLFRLENLAFAEAIRNGAPSPIPADEMLITNVIIQGLIDSAAAGREVAVSVPEV
jgi:predicted dehydrogenase